MNRDICFTFLPQICPSVYLGEKIYHLFFQFFSPSLSLSNHRVENLRPVEDSSKDFLSFPPSQSPLAACSLRAAAGLLLCSAWVCVRPLACLHKGIPTRISREAWLPLSYGPQQAGSAKRYSYTQYSYSISIEVST